MRRQAVTCGRVGALARNARRGSNTHIPASAQSCVACWPAHHISVKSGAEAGRDGLGLAPPLVGCRPRRCGASPAPARRRALTLNSVLDRPAACRAQVADLDRAESLAEARRAVLPGLPAARGALHEAPPAEPVSRQARAPARAPGSGRLGLMHHVKP